MGRLVDDAVVVLESIHRHQSWVKAFTSGSSPPRHDRGRIAGAGLNADDDGRSVACPILAGLAKKLFAPLAHRRRGDDRIHFVSMSVTPVACHFWVTSSMGRIGRRIEHVIDRLADGYARALRRVLPFRWTIVLASLALVIGSGWAAGHLPSTFFPEIDESMT